MLDTGTIVPCWTSDGVQDAQLEGVMPASTPSLFSSFKVPALSICDPPHTP